MIQNIQASEFFRVLGQFFRLLLALGKIYFGLDSSMHVDFRVFTAKNLVYFVDE